MTCVSTTIKQSFSSLGRLGGSLAETMEKVAEAVRNKPDSPEPRRILADLFCLDGQWERALKHMQTAANLSSAFMPDLFVCRLLVQCEIVRSEVLSGRTPPVWRKDEPEWAQPWVKALSLLPHGDSPCNTRAMDAAREEAFALVTEIAGQSNLGEFSWISDSDTRLGPVCEMIIGGRYLFVPFSEIAAISSQGPASPRDLVWLPVKTRFKDSGKDEEEPAFIPARYPGSESASDDIRLGRRTEWSNQGDTGVLGLGQKTWITDRVDLPLLDLRQCDFV